MNNFLVIGKWVVTNPYPGIYYVQTDNENDVVNVAIYLQKEGFRPELVAKRKVEAPSVSKKKDFNIPNTDGNDWTHLV